MGGDIMGKFLVPIVHEHDSHYRVSLQGTTESIEGADALQAVKERIETLGFYHITVAEDELHAMQADQQTIDGTFHRLARERIERWIALADERLSGTGVKWYVTGGNDDPPDVLTVFDEVRSEHVVNCEGRVVLVDDIFPMANCGYSNPTPWGTPREVEEAVLEDILEEAVQGIEDYTSAIFNLHVPPYDCTLDDCPKLDWSTDPPSPIVVGGVPQSAPAGSTAVRKIIEKYAPLLALTGHIHESRGLVNLGRTTVINPGSEYGEGIIRGCILTLEPGKLVGYQMTAG
ncbi:MAG: metallophosphoesterase family protein [Ilumatobacteraceae bacterium]